MNKLSFWKYIGASIPTSVVVIEKTGHILYENEVFNDKANDSDDNFISLIDDHYLIPFNDDLTLCEHKHKILKNNLRFKKIGKETSYFTYFLFPLKQNCFSLILINNTEMYNQNIMLNNIINTVPDPIFVKDEKHTYQYVNQAFVQALGYSAEELLGKSDADFFSPKEHDVFYKMDCKTFKSEMTTTSEEKFTTKVLDTRVASTKKSIFRTLNDTKILVGVIRDITEISKERKVLEKHSQGLKRQVDIRTKQLKAKNDDLTLAIKKLKSLNSDLDCFAHMCCHELREPLRTISSFSKLAKDKFPGDVNGDMSLFLHEIYEGTLRMDKLIRAILDYSTNGLSNSVMSSFYPHELIAEVLTMLDTQMKEKNASIHFNEMPAIYADRLQIIQLFQNLISNATKFCAPLTRPVINITARPVNQFIEFKLTDKGIGIAKKYHKELFLPFKKFHSKSEGSMYGIGLSLCKKIIENHGGSIKISSRENMGTTFTFLLPSIERN